MTNSAKKMIGKNIERRNVQSKSERKSRSPKVQSATYFNTLATPVRGKQLQFSELRLSPNTSPRTSPGLLSGHFAGGKWSEPPSPTELPTPPTQWTQLMFAPKCSRSASKQNDVTKHLKMLLNVQA